MSAKRKQQLTVRRSSEYKGVLRRCSCAEGAPCSHWSYGVEVTVNARRRQLTGSSFTSEVAASRARGKAIAAADDDKVAADTRTTVAEWIRKWLSERIDAGELRPSTARSYRDLAETHLLPRVGSIRLATLRAAHLTSAYRSLVADRAKAGQDRTVPLDAGTMGILKAHAGRQLVEHTDDGWVFADEIAGLEAQLKLRARRNDR